MNIVLWMLQFLLALAFLAHGWLLLAPPPELIDQMNASMTAPLRIFIGVAEVLAAVGLTLPGITRILPASIVWAAAGLMIVMICATVFHIVRGEYTSALTKTALFVLLTFVAYMRWKVRPIRPRAQTGGASAHAAAR